MAITERFIKPSKKEENKVRNYETSSMHHYSSRKKKNKTNNNKQTQVAMTLRDKKGRDGAIKQRAHVYIFFSLFKKGGGYPSLKRPNTWQKTQSPAEPNYPK
jgi:hypothetical protein